jgi:hypothetical protein
MQVWGSARGERARFGFRRHTERHEKTQTDTDMLHRDSPHRETRADTHRHRQTQALKMPRKASAQKMSDKCDQSLAPFRETPIYADRHRQTHAVLV